MKRDKERSDIPALFTDVPYLPVRFCAVIMVIVGLGKSTSYKKAVRLPRRGNSPVAGMGWFEVPPRTGREGLYDAFFYRSSVPKGTISLSLDWTYTTR